MFGYHVAIHAQLFDHVSHAMHRISATMIQAQGNTSKFQEQLQKLHGTMTKISALQTTGNGLFATGANGINAMIDPAKEYATQLAKMNLAAKDHLELQKDIKNAWEVSDKVQTASVAGVLGTQLDLYNIIGGSPEKMEETRMMMPKMKQIEAVIGAASGDPHAAEGQILAGVKALDMMGKVKPEEIIDGLDWMRRVVQTTNNRVNMIDFAGTTKYERAMKITLDDNFKYRVLPVFIEEMKGANGAGSGGGPGTMINAFGRQMVQGVMSKKVFENLDALGLIEGGSLETTTTGTIADHVVRNDLASKDPAAWVEQVFLPAIKEANPDADTAELTLKTMETLAGGNQLSTAFVTEMLSKIDNGQIKRYQEIFDKIPSLDKSYEMAKQSPVFVEMAWEAQWKSLMISLGKELLPLIPIILGFAKAIGAIAKFFNENPWAAQMVTFGLVAMMVVGGIMAIGAGVALLLLPLTLFGAGLTEIGLIAGIVVASIAFVTSGIMLFVNVIKLATINVVDWFLDMVKPLMMLINPSGFNSMKSALHHDTGAVTPLKANYNTGDVTPLTFGEEPAPLGPIVPIKKASATKGGDTNSTSLELAAGAIQIIAAPGMDQKAIAEAVVKELARAAQRNFLSLGGTGLLNSPVLAGGLE